MNEKKSKPLESEITCSRCHSRFFLGRLPSEFQEPQYCAFCGNSLNGQNSSVGSTSSSGGATFIQGHAPEPTSIQFQIGPYQVLSSIGKGGMGEVFLAYDTICGRRIALKKVRTDLQQHAYLHNRFLKEARITSQLTHPSIIPIYSIHEEAQLIYYTMPYVEGEDLKQILRRTRAKEKKREKVDHIGTSIPALIRILLNICQAVAYAHSNHVLHRDLKPENIIVGRFGEVLILDWGLAILTEEPSSKNLESPESDEEIPVKGSITNHGKVVGTVAYMAPERAMGNPATYQTDIYALGVILYQMLCLHLPFRRENLQEFRKTMRQELYIDPAEVAPYREVPKILSQICQKCLEPDPEARYHTLDQLIRDLESYIEGRSEWFLATQLNIQNKSDWEFQENVLIAEHMAITRNTEMFDWVSLMISKASLGENCKIEARVRIGEKGHGIGFLFSIPEASERTHLNDGYCLWLGSDSYKSTKLLRSTVEVLQASDISLIRHDWYQICIEKVDNKIHLYLNNQLQFTYISYLPLPGTHVGLLLRDDDFEITDFSIYVGSQNVMVNCLAVPDAFLAHKDYPKALTEYRRIGYSFPGRAEGREAMFRAGITLLEQARAEKTPTEKYFDLALEEFEKLRNTPGAPLEHLGKALVYESLSDYEEEVKCYTLACRKYPHHPLLHVLKEQIVYRMHESSRFHRLTTYRLILLVLRHLPEIATDNHSQKLFASLQKHWEILPFIEEESHPDAAKKLKNLSFALAITFWLAKPYFLAEIIDELSHLPTLYSSTLGNALFCLMELGSWQLAQSKMESFLEARKPEEQQEVSQLYASLQIALLSHTKSLEEAIKAYFSHIHQQKVFLNQKQLRVLFYLLEQALHLEKFPLVHQIQKQLSGYSLGEKEQLQLDCYVLWALLWEKRWEEAGELLHKNSLEQLSKETSLLHFLYGCWLQATEGKEIALIHFSGILEVSYPRTWTLATHYLNDRIGKEDRWLQKAFLWEKRALYHQLVLYYHCAGDAEKEALYRDKYKQEFVDAV